ncbi:hypothetical protein ABK040_011626 [Willaertia magna]
MQGNIFPNPHLNAYHDFLTLLAEGDPLHSNEALLYAATNNPSNNPSFPITQQHPFINLNNDHQDIFDEISNNNNIPSSNINNNNITDLSTVVPGCFPQQQHNDLCTCFVCTYNHSFPHHVNATTAALTAAILRSNLHSSRIHNHLNNPYFNANPLGAAFCTNPNRMIPTTNAVNTNNNPSSFVMNNVNNLQVSSLVNNNNVNNNNSLLVATTLLEDVQPTSLSPTIEIGSTPVSSSNSSSNNNTSVATPSTLPAASTTATSNTEVKVETKATSKKQANTTVKTEEEVDECRNWKDILINNEILDESDIQVNIYLETRDSGPRSDPTIDSELYSSIKYEMRHEIKNLLFHDCDKANEQLFCRVQVVHPDNKNEVLKNGKTILGGAIESHVTKGTSNDNSATSMKIKFTDCSYHHGNCKFAFKVSYFLESDLDNPILIKESAAFKVLARKPSKNKTKNPPTKRKKKEQEAATKQQEQTQKTQAPKKLKITTVEDFKQTTNTLFEFIQNSSDEQTKKHLINFVASKMCVVDPSSIFHINSDDGTNDIFKALL